MFFFKLGSTSAARYSPFNLQLPHVTSNLLMKSSNFLMIAMVIMIAMVMLIMVVRTDRRDI